MTDPTTPKDALDEWRVSTAIDAWHIACHNGETQLQGMRRVVEALDVWDQVHFIRRVPDSTTDCVCGHRMALHPDCGCVAPCPSPVELAAELAVLRAQRDAALARLRQAPKHAPNSDYMLLVADLGAALGVQPEGN